MAYNAGTNYQQLINDAVARGDMASAAKYEQQRNEKIAGTGSSQQQTSLYSQYLGAQGTPASQNANSQISSVLNRAVGNGKSAGENLGLYTNRQGAVTTLRPEFAGQTVKVGDKYVTYDAKGSPVKAISAAHAESLGNDYVSQNMGFDMDKTADAGGIYQALYNLLMGGNGSTVSGSEFNNAYGLHNVQYDKTKTLADYDALIQQAAAAGNNVLAGYYEDSRNALIADQGLDPNLQTSKYNGGWNYVDNGGGVGNIYTGALKDPVQEDQALGGGWWQEQDKGTPGANTAWYNNHSFPTMEEVMAYGKALGYDMDENTPALTPLVKQMIDSGYVSPEVIRKANTLSVTMPAVMKNLGIEADEVSGNGAQALSQTIAALRQGSGAKNASYVAALQAAAQDAAQRYAAGGSVGGNNSIGGSGSAGYENALSGLTGGSLEEQLLGLYGEGGGYAQALEQLKALVNASTQQATGAYQAEQGKVNKSYADMFRQLYIDRENSKKNIGQQMAVSGITGGASESTLLGLNTSYEEALRQGEQERIGAIDALQQAIVNAQLSGDIAYAEQALQLSQQQIDNYASVLQALIARQDSLAQQQAAAQMAAQSENRSYAYEQAMALLSAGQMPDSSLLSAAGISSATAQGFMNAYAAQSAGNTGSGKGSGSGNGSTGSGGSGGGSSGGSGGGSGSGTAGSGYSGNFSSVYEALATGHPEKALTRLDQIWGSLSDKQKSEVQTILKGYGYQYNP